MKVVIVGTPNCSYCDLAKKLCASEGIDVQYMELHTDISPERLNLWVGSTVRTVPQVFVDGIHIGGYTDLDKFIKDKQMFDFNELQNKIIQWAKDRNLIEGSDSFRQFNKLGEETLELFDGLQAGEISEISDALGDVIVVLTIIAEQNGLRLLDCINGAYEEIKDRKGKMVDGVFVKEVA